MPLISPLIPVPTSIILCFKKIQNEEILAIKTECVCVHTDVMYNVSTVLIFVCNQKCTNKCWLHKQWTITKFINCIFCTASNIGITTK